MATTSTDQRAPHQQSLDGECRDCAGYRCGHGRYNEEFLTAMGIGDLTNGELAKLDKAWQRGEFTPLRTSNEAAKHLEVVWSI